MKQAFKYERLSGKVLTMIDRANEILEEYAADGFVMTLRMLHYQFVARQLFANTYRNYKKLGWAMAQGRLMGLVDWDHLEDQIRRLDEMPTWESPAAILADTPRWYKEDIWEPQEFRPEIWVEKGALLSVIRKACTDLRLPALACRGYVSQSAQYEAHNRFKNWIDEGKTPIVFHLGDHDPSGLDMTRDNRETFELMTGEPIEVIRLALNWDQVQYYNPPPNPVKMRDSRVGGYMRRFGRQSWELDALSPKVIDKLIRDAVTPLIDQKIWKRSINREQENRAKLSLIAEHSDIVIDRLERAQHRGLI